MITRNRILFALGLWIVLVPFLGFPTPYKSVFMIVSGLAVIVLAFLYARDRRMSEMPSAKNAAQVSQTKPVVASSTKVFEESYPVFTKSESARERYMDLEAIRNRSSAMRTH